MRWIMVAKPSLVIFWQCSLAYYWNLYNMPKETLHALYICLWTDMCMRHLTICSYNISTWNSRSSYIQELVKHIDIVCHTFPWFYHSSSFRSYWPSVKRSLSVSLTSIWAETIQERLERHSQPMPPGFLDLRFHYLSVYQVHHLLRNYLRCCLDYPRRNSSFADFHRQKSFQVRHPAHILLGASQFFGFSKHSIFKFVLQGGSLQTKLVANVIFPTIWIQPHHPVENVTTMRGRFLQCPTLFPQLSSA